MLTVRTHTTLTTYYLMTTRARRSFDFGLAGRAPRFALILHRLNDFFRYSLQDQKRVGVWFIPTQCGFLAPLSSSDTAHLQAGHNYELQSNPNTQCTVGCGECWDYSGSCTALAIAALRMGCISNVIRRQSAAAARRRHSHRHGVGAP